MQTSTECKFDAFTLQATAGLVSDLFFYFFSEAYETYTIWLRAFTWKHEGASSESFEVLTDVQVNKPCANEVFHNFLNANKTMCYWLLQSFTTFKGKKKFLKTKLDTTSVWMPRSRNSG